MATETTVRVKYHLFTVEDYYRMAEVGILQADDRVELVRGEIVQMAPIGSRHQSVVDRLTSLFSRRLASERTILRVQGPILLDDMSEPQPDVCLLNQRDDFYEGRHPGPEDVLMLVEISDTSLAYDRLVKLPLYAQAGVPEVWIVNLEEESLEVSSEPREGAYSRNGVLARGNSLAPGAFPEARFSVDEVLGPPLHP
jgi:Uma2 family endonuclease